MTRRPRPSEPLPAALSGWPGWAAFAALGGTWIAGLLATVLAAVAFTGAGAAAGRLAVVLLSAAGTVAALAWLAARTGRLAPDRFGLRPVDPRRALDAVAVAVALLAASCALLALSGALGELRVPRELSRLDGLAWEAGAGEPAVPFDAAAAAALLCRAVIGVAVLELVLRGVVLAALARLIGAWPAIGATAVLGAVSFGAVAGDGRLLLPALVLGALLGPLAVATGSIVPGAGLSAAFAGAALAGACGWGPLAAAAVALACATLAAALLFGIAGSARRTAPERLAAPGVRGLVAEQGQTAAESMGMLLLVALIVGALVAIGLQTQIANQVGLLICRIAGGDCAAQQAAADKDCLVSSSTSKGGAAVTVAIVKVGQESTMIKQVYADGRTVFTLLKNGSAAAELIAGAKARAGKVGFDASASASAGGKLEGARTYTFTDPEKAKQFEDQVRSHGSFGQVARDAVEGFDPFGLKDWALDHTIGADVDPEDLPTPDSTYVSVEALIRGEAKAIGNVVIADAGAKGLLQYAGGARLYTSGPDKGKVELNLKLDAEVAANLGLLTFGPEVNAKSQFIATVTLDKDHGYRPSHLKVIGNAGYNGDLRDADVVLKPTEGQIKEVQNALKAGKLKSAAFGSTDGTGKQVELSADMDLTTDAERDDALALFSGVVPATVAAGRTVARLDEKGRLTFQVYDTTASSTEAGLKVGLGPGIGAEGSQTRDDRDLGGSWVREPGAGWARRNCGLR
ncbi:MAG TPA: CPBP family intramembrane glutamic endopeptidase [Solirubrobacteraceae bacterium]|nr:CPBP family intramembrane glutamic endopeptidase [Solirubrobacteraceae bacterium]